MVPLSPEGSRIREHISRDMLKRKPVAYRYPFLNTYRPNVSHYLDKQTLATLHAVGTTAAQPQPAGTLACMSCKKSIC